MDYVSTRGGAKATAAEAVLRGMAEGGGLYVPETFPQITGEEMSAMLGMDYAERAALILGKFFEEFPEEELLGALKTAYKSFEGDPVPLVKIEDGLFILELFHGPTCARSDLGAAVLPYFLEKSRQLLGKKERVLVLAASSGDSGKAVLEAFRDREQFKAAVFYPEDGVSKMQKLQLGAQDGENLLAVGVRGTFDDCQAAVKKVLRSQELRDKLLEKGVLLTSGNSANIGQLLPQIACFFSAYLDLVSSDQLKMGERTDFSVPAGNFGGAIAGFYAKKMGLPIRKIVCASNRNNALSELFSKGVYDRKRSFYRTMSPSLDVQVASNVERLIFEITDRDAALTVERMKSLAANGRYTLRAEEMKALGESFFGGFAGEEDTVETVYEFFEEFNYPLDTQTGVAVNVARQYVHASEEATDDPRPMIVAAEASPYKFPQAVYYALTGNDVKDSFKGIKRIHLITAMKVPEALKALRYRPIRFKGVAVPDKVAEEVLNFA